MSASVAEGYRSTVCGGSAEWARATATATPAMTTSGPLTYPVKITASHSHIEGVETPESHGVAAYCFVAKSTQVPEFAR